jgi:hypothetical protein
MRLRNGHLAGLALTAVLAGCATAERYDASADVHAFLVAVRDGDQAAFDAHVDRPALKANLKARLLSATASKYGAEGPETLGAVLAQPLVDVAVDALVRPQVFKAAAELEGYGPQTRIPNSFVLGQAIRPIGPDRVCAVIRGRCTFIFKQEDASWKLIDYAGDFGLLKRNPHGRA